jgi:putative transposase
VGSGTHSGRNAQAEYEGRQEQRAEKHARPARLGPSGQSWGTFLRNHASEIWACDFLQTYDALFRSIFVFVIIELESRRVVHVNVTRHPTTAWVAQQLWEATPFGEGPRFLVRDNDKKYGGQFQGVADEADIDILNTPVEAPRANAFCERFLGSVRRECLDHILILSERHLRRKVKEYVRYFNRARPHQAINGQIPIPSSPPSLIVPPLSRLRRIPILGGFITTINGLREGRILSGRRK